MDKVQEQVCLYLMTPWSLATREEAALILQLWEELLPAYLPEKWGNWEPIDRVFDLNRRNEILDQWDNPFLAKRSKPRMESHLFTRRGKNPPHATWSFDFRSGEVDVAVLSRFLCTACERLGADLGLLTLLTPEEIARGRQADTVLVLDKKATRFGFSMTTHQIKKYLPDLYWLTVFGPPYVQMFGLEKLLAAPTFKRERIGEQTVALQLTPDLYDMRRPDEFQEVRAQIKTLLGEQAFFRGSQMGEYLRPHFALGEVKYEPQS